MTPFKLQNVLYQSGINFITEYIEKKYPVRKVSVASMSEDFRGVAIRVSFIKGRETRDINSVNNSTRIDVESKRLTIIIRDLDRFNNEHFVPEFIKEFDIEIISYLI